MVFCTEGGKKMFSIEIWQEVEIKQALKQENLREVAEELKMEEATLVRFEQGLIPCGAVFRLILTLYFKTRKGLLDGNNLKQTPKEFWRISNV